MIRTVLPTPAPPNRPLLPPRSSGARTSIALMPVTNSSEVVGGASERNRRRVNRSPLAALDGRFAVDGVAEYVEHAAQHSLADRDAQRIAACR